MIEGGEIPFDHAVEGYECSVNLSTCVVEESSLVGMCLRRKRFDLLNGNPCGNRRKTRPIFDENIARKISVTPQIANFFDIQK